MKKIVFAFLCILLLESVCHADNWKRLDTNVKPVATGDEIGVLYVTGLPEIDQSTTCYQYNIRLAFDQNDVVLKRNMIDQERGHGIKAVEVARIPYASIKDLIFGYDAAYAAQEDKLPTAQKEICNNMRLVMALQMIKSPVVIVFEKDKKPISFVVTAPDNDAVRLYEGLAERAHIKAKAPLAYKGIIKQRAKLDPPPADSER